MGGLRFPVIKMQKLGRNIPGMLRNLSYRSAPWVPAPAPSPSTPPFKFRSGILITTTAVLGTAFLYWIDCKGIRTKFGRPVSVEEYKRRLNEVIITKENMIKERMLELRTTNEDYEKILDEEDDTSKERLLELRTAYEDYEKRLDEVDDRLKERMLKLRITYEDYEKRHDGKDDMSKERMLELRTTYADYEKFQKEYIARERARIAKMKAEQLKGQVGES